MVVYICTSDSDTGAVSNIETISIVTETTSITSRCIDGDIVDCQPISVVNTENLDRWVENVDVLNSRRDQVVCGEEFGLRLSSVGTFSIPVGSSFTIEICTTALSDGDICS